MKTTVKVYDDAGNCVSVHVVQSDKTGTVAIIDALSRAYNAECEAVRQCGPDNGNCDAH